MESLDNRFTSQVDFNDLMRSTHDYTDLVNDWLTEAKYTVMVNDWLTEAKYTDLVNDWLTEANGRD